MRTNNVLISFLEQKDQKTAHTIVCRSIIKKNLSVYLPLHKEGTKKNYRLVVDIFKIDKMNSIDN